MRHSQLRTSLSLLPFLLCATKFAVAQLQTSPAFGTDSTTTSIVDGVLLPEEAFALTAFLEADGKVVLSWEMPPEGYYLYRKSLMLSLADGTELDTFEVPEGRMVEDEFFGESEVYFERLLLRLPLNAVPDSAYSTSATGARQLDLLVGYQGCAQDKYCYPPQYTEVSVEIPE